MSRRRFIPFECRVVVLERASQSLLLHCQVQVFHEFAQLIGFITQQVLVVQYTASRHPTENAERRIFPLLQLSRYKIFPVCLMTSFYRLVNHLLINKLIRHLCPQKLMAMRVSPGAGVPKKCTSIRKRFEGISLFVVTRRVRKVTSDTWWPGRSTMTQHQSRREMLKNALQLANPDLVC